ncbi:exo-alpha-sialidase [Actinocrinis puniceicyclus]|uniref:Exo-alpha-sialidase n=1 Tax=Actinocrinis puniceicyclus TaxID=977794 RepID=A0A8J7WUH5_9ACTN|nr:CHAP domain-containing protein [Actinocrinis puniceicyclus]MBS2965374.1 exo-alpha-sialidase [Actinocrinis puniceicyclus]
MTGALLATGAGAAHATGTVRGAQTPKTVIATVDGVALTISASHLPDAPAVVSELGLPLQEVALHSARPYYSLTVTAVPYGKADSWDFPNGGAARPGVAAAWSAALRSERDREHGDSHRGPTARLFGKDVAGTASSPDVPLDAIHYEKLDMIEWVAEAGDRVFVVQLSQERRHPVTGFGAGLALSGTALDAPTSIGRVEPASEKRAQADLSGARTPAAGMAAVRRASYSEAPLGATLPAPSWWNGTTCDTAQNSRSYPLTSATVRGVLACGPLPETSGDSGTWGGISEWQCTELAERYMYLAGYISGQYAANGGQIVANYPGSLLEKKSSGAGPTSPAAGDVVSMATTHVEGHTALVLANHVDSSGNGYVTILQQNFSTSGTGTMNVVNGVLKSEESGYGASWLHDPRNDAPPSVSPLSGIANGGGYHGTVTVGGTASQAASAFYVHLRQNGVDKFVSHPAIPGGTSFSYQLDTTAVPDGTYQALVGAVINGTAYYSSPVTINIANAVGGRYFLPGGGWEAMWLGADTQNPGGSLWLAPGSGNALTGAASDPDYLGVAQGTSPSMAVLPNGTWVAAWHGTDTTNPGGSLWIATGNGNSLTAVAEPGNLGVAAGSSPSIVAMADNTWTVAWHGEDTLNPGGSLWIATGNGTSLSAAAAPGYLGVAANSSPSLVVMPNGTWTVAWHGEDTLNPGGSLWIATGNGTSLSAAAAPGYLGVAPNTSPSLVVTPNGTWASAWHGEDTINPGGSLWVATGNGTSLSGAASPGNLGVADNTSPSLTAMGDGTWTAAWHGADTINPGGSLWIATGNGTGLNAAATSPGNLGVAADTSPTIVTMPDGSWMTAWHGEDTINPSGSLWVAPGRGTGLNAAATSPGNLGVAAGSSPTLVP